MGWGGSISGFGERSGEDGLPALLGFVLFAFLLLVIPRQTPF